MFGVDGRLDMAEYRWQPSMEREVKVPNEENGSVMARSSVQERYAPHNRCFGCGPANEQGLRIKSFIEGDELVCEWSPAPHHEAFAGEVNGGIIGTLFD